MSLKTVESESQRFFSRKVEEVERRTKDEAEQRAARILATAVQRYASEYVEENMIDQQVTDTLLIDTKGNALSQHITQDDSKGNFQGHSVPVVAPQASSGEKTHSATPEPDAKCVPTALA